jgi:DMSO/TMAO reductase YedYZ heme-binding membrane subunit
VKSQMWWYMARSGGVVAWALSAISVVWGLLLSSRVLKRRIHRFLGGLAVVFTGIHVTGLLLDPKVPFGLADVLVPFASSWHPGAVAWGVVAFYLLIAVEVTSLLRRRIGERVWRSVHYCGFAVFLCGTIHGLKAGTDVENPLIWWPAAGASAAIVGLCVARIFANGDPVPRKRAVVDGARPAADLLERTLEGLRQLEDAPALPVFMLDEEPVPVPPPYESPHASAPLPPALTPEQSVSGSLFPSQHEVMAEPGHLDLTVPPGLDESRRADEPAAPDAWSLEAAAGFARSPAEPIPPSTPIPTRAPQPELLPEWSMPTPIGDHESRTAVRDLPVRTPRRLARTTAAAESLGSWRPAVAVETARTLAPPAPPAAIDPTTGEPDPQAYCKWLREWLAYVESQG